MLPVLAPVHKPDPEPSSQCRWNPWAPTGKNVKGEENYNSVSGAVSGEIMDNNWSTEGRSGGMICAPSSFLPDQFKVTLSARTRAAWRLLQTTSTEKIIKQKGIRRWGSPSNNVHEHLSGYFRRIFDNNNNNL